MAEPTAPTEEEIKSRIKFASGLYSTARDQMDEDEELFTGEYVLSDEIKDLEIEIVKPPRPMAIVFKFLSRLAVRADMGIQVVPRTLADKEEEICTVLERWLEGYKFQAEYEAEDPIYRYFVTWFLLRGRGCLELRLSEADTKSGEALGIYPVIDDPYYISPVYGARGIMYYAKEYERYVWDIREELKQRGAGGEGIVWEYPKNLDQKKDTDRVEIQEYWDKGWHAAFIDKEVVFLKRNPFGFVPLRQAKAMDTPLEAAEWASQSILHPIADILKNQAILMSKVATGVEMFYWPWLFVQEPGGRSYVIENTPGVLQSIHPDAKVTVINPIPNQGLVQQLNMMLESEINLVTLPEIAWGAEPGTLQSGRAISQVLAQTLDVIEDKRENLERALGRHLGDVLRLVDAYSGLAKDDKFAVMAMPEEPGRKRRDLVAIGKEEVDGHMRVIVNLSPPLPEDKMVRYEIARRAKDLGMDVRSILSMILEVPNPDEIVERMEKEMFQQMSPEILEHKRQKYLEQYCEEEKVKIEELRALMPTPPGPPGAEGGEGELGGLSSEVMPHEELGEPTEPGPEEAAMLAGVVP